MNIPSRFKLPNLTLWKYRPLVSDSSDDNSSYEPFRKEKSESSIQRPNPASESIYTRIAVWILALVCVCETFALISQNYFGFLPLHPLIKSPVPSVGREVREWPDEPSLHGLRTKEAVEAAWDHLDLPISGFVYLPNPKQYGLLPNEHVVAGAENVYSVSAYHQLHCLKIMHLTFVELYNAETQSDEMALEHIEHCLAYIKQGVMCAGDTALEGPDIGGGTLQGWGIKHECRRWDGEHGLVKKIDVLNDEMFQQIEKSKAKKAES